MIMPFHRLKAQAEPPHWEESDFKQSWQHILCYSDSSNVPITMYTSSFQGKTSTNTQKLPFDQLGHGVCKL